MTAVEIGISPLSDTEHRAQLRRALIASTVGTTIEWYDFLLYGQVTGLVFGKLFFPQSDPIVGVLQAFAVFFVGFLGRPIGAAIFGHWGDRIGRKATLIATLLVTGLATMAVGLVPTYESIGIWGAVLLVVIRLIQGIGVGGEWGGSVLLAMEWARTNKNRGLLAAWPQFGGPAGLFLANLAVLFFSWLSGDQFLVWGWRIPFLLSIVMVGIGLWIRLGITETPVFQKVLDEERIERVPVLQVLKRQPKQVALTALVRMPEQAPGYIVGTFIFTYATTVLGAPAQFCLDGGPRSGRAGIYLGPDRRTSVRPHRPQTHVYDRVNLCRDLRLHLLCVAGHQGTELDVYRHRAVVASGDDVLRPPGGADRRELLAPPALQRRLARLSAGLDHRRRPLAVYRDGAVCRLCFELPDCPLYPRLAG